MENQKRVKARNLLAVVAHFKKSWVEENGKRKLFRKRKHKKENNF